MKENSPKMELEALVSLCIGNDEVQSYLLGALNTSFFGLSESQEIFRRVRHLVKEFGKNIPSVNILAEDLSLSDESREMLKKWKNISVAPSADKARVIVYHLDKYRKARICLKYSTKVYDLMRSSKADPELAIKSFADAVKESIASIDMEKDILHIGKDCNAHQLVADIINGKVTQMIPTGFENFDKVNGGFFRGSLVSLAATTSGGKSALSIQLLINMYRAKYNVGLVSLEMNHEEIITRILANLARVDSMLVKKNQMSKKEAIRMGLAWGKFAELGKKADNRYSIYTPRDYLLIEDICYRMARYKYDVLVVDYATLVKHEAESWIALSEIAKFLKRFAQINNMVTILLCQLSEENKIRYSGAIREHSDNVWSWVYNREIAQETGRIITIDQQKARNQQVFDFKIDERFDFMTLTDYKDDSEDPLTSDNYSNEEEFSVEDDLEEF